MQVWDAAGGGHIRWDAKDIGAESMGCVAENGLLQASLLAAAQRSAGATEFLWPATLAQLHLPGTTSSTSTSTSTSTTGGSGASSAHSPADAEGLGSATSGVALGVAVTNAGGTAFTTAVPTQSEAGSPTSASSTGAPSSAGVGDGLALLVLEDGRRLRSRLVVAADGANSQVRRLAGLRTFGWDYHQRGVVAAVATESPHSTAWQAFLPTGPLALLPTRGGLSNIVWSTDPAAARRLEAMSPIEFAAAADAALQAGAGAGAVRPPRVISCPGSGPVRSFPLRSQHVGVYVLPRLALIGDAAHAVHPLAGQGVNLGFGDAVALADALAAAKQCGQDVGDVLLLEEQYQVPRQRAVMAMAAALDGVKGAFAVQAGPLAALRSLGLGALNWAGPVKNRVMKFAMGL